MADDETQTASMSAGREDFETLFVERHTDGLYAGVTLHVPDKLLNVKAGLDYRMAENFMPAIFGTQDVEEGRKAFEERREPVYEGN